jgi:hypothetical protein
MMLEKNGMFVSPDGNIRALDWQPGNGTRYELVATKLGGIHEGYWLVASPNFGGCMEVSEGSYLSMGYVQEKFVPRSGRKLDGDLGALTLGIAKLVPGVRADSEAKA